MFKNWGQFPTMKGKELNIDIRVYKNGNIMKPQLKGSSKLTVFAIIKIGKLKLREG